MVVCSNDEFVCDIILKVATGGTTLTMTVFFNTHQTRASSDFSFLFAPVRSRHFTFGLRSVVLRSMSVVSKIPRQLCALGASNHAQKLWEIQRVLTHDFWA